MHETSPRRKTCGGECLQFITEGEVDYDETHIAACDDILGKYLEFIDVAPDKSTGLQHTRDAVLALNELNDRCDGELIETDQREGICALINRGGALRGFNADDEDMTEEWREW